MKTVRRVWQYAMWVFPVLAGVIALLMKTGILQTIPFERGTGILMAMAVATAAVMVLRDALLPDIWWLRTGAGIAGAILTVLAIGYMSGWFIFTAQAVGIVSGVTAAVYAGVWLVTTLYYRRQAEDLNETLEAVRKRQDGL